MTPQTLAFRACPHGVRVVSNPPVPVGCRATPSGCVVAGMVLACPEAGLPFLCTRLLFAKPFPVGAELSGRRALF